MLTKLLNIVKKNYLLILSILISAMCIKAGIYIAGLPPQDALRILNITGGLVIGLAIFLFCWVMFIIWSGYVINFVINKISQLTMAVGSFMLAFEYVMSVVFQIDLNVYGSMFWNDIGSILLIFSLINFCVAPFIKAFIYFKKIERNDKSNDTL